MAIDNAKRYKVKLTATDHKCPPQIRHLYRETDESAIDGAVRWLRLHRNSRPGMAQCDRWEVNDVSQGEGRARFVARGWADDA